MTTSILQPFLLCITVKKKQPDYDFGKSEADSGADKGDLIAKWEAENGLTEYGTLREIAEYFEDKYGISDELDEQDKYDIMAVRYEMEQKDFGSANSFILATDVSDIVVQRVKEKYATSGFADIIADTGVKGVCQTNHCGSYIGQNGNNIRGGIRAA